MTRITDNQLTASLLSNINKKRGELDRYSTEVSTGLKVLEPGDSKFAGTIAQFQQQLERVDGAISRVGTIESQLLFQDSILNEAVTAVVRAKEIATQGANETLDTVRRQELAGEVWQIRDHLVNLANSTYQGRYIFSGAMVDQEPYSATTTTYANGPTAPHPALERYVYIDTTANPGAATVRSVNVTTDLTMDINTPGNQIFDQAIFALERLGRALEGYETLPNTRPVPDTSAPDGTGAAYNFPADYANQTQDILNTIDLLELSRATDLIPEQIDIGGRLNRLSSTKSLLESTKVSAKEVLSRLQDADITESASNLQQAQTALEASFAVTSRFLNLSVLDFL